MHRGFTNAKRAYLPTEKAKGRSVESQSKDEKSLYNTVKKLIALHKAYPQFSYGADLEVKNDGYPLEFFRTANHESIYIAINPTDKEYTLSYDGKEILLAENAQCKEKTIKLGGCGFIVIKI